MYWTMSPCRSCEWRRISSWRGCTTPMSLHLLHSYAGLSVQVAGCVEVIHFAAHIIPSNYKLPIVNISIFQMPHPIRNLKIQLRSEFRNLASRRRQPLHKFIVPKKHAKLHKRSRRTSSVTFSFIMFIICLRYEHVATSAFRLSHLNFRNP